MCNTARPSPSTTDDPRSELRRLYDDLDRDVREIGPVCALSGRCCRFEEFGHTLFVSAPEFAFLVEEAPAPLRPVDDGATCPWQDSRGHCAAREARPLGCRVYYCDPDYGETGQALSETFISRLKSLARQFDVPWDYAPLHTHLRRAVADGRLCQRAVSTITHEDPSQVSNP